MRTQLNIKRAKDREIMASEIQKIARQHAAVSNLRTGEIYPGPRAICVDIRAPGGLCVSVCFDAMNALFSTEQANTHVLNWYVPSGIPAELNQATFGGNVNPYHRRKATYVALGFESLCEQLSKGLALCQSGEAYLKTLPDSQLAAS